MADTYTSSPVTGPAQRVAGPVKTYEPKPVAAPRLTTHILTALIVLIAVAVLGGALFWLLA